MRIFVAGASGAVGRRLVPMLVTAGHDVVGTTQSPTKVELVRGLGAEPVVVDALDAGSVRSAVEQARPDVVVHELTALSGPASLRSFDRSFARTNQLRTAGTDNLLAAARAAGAGRFVVQGFIGWNNERTGGPVKTEDDPMDPHPTAASRQTVAAMRRMEATVTGAAGIEGLVLRYGLLYGPGTSIGPDGDILRMVHKRQLPVVGGGTGIWSFVHVEDAARATALAIDSAVTGVLNIVDDEPAPVSRWLPYLAQAIGAKPPWHLPSWVARPLIGEHGISMMTAARGASNARARRELAWQPQFASWRQGFPTLTG